MLFPLEVFNETAVVISGGFSGADATVLLLPIPAQIRQHGVCRDKQEEIQCRHTMLYKFVKIAAKATEIKANAIW
ncbi:hypothetical protein AR688_07555 [Rheinheimera sp. EpRS3]|nr:hypothetical protein AR688_07555 [Rheinheimera sp. EpRS3]